MKNRLPSSGRLVQWRPRSKKWPQLVSKTENKPRRRRVDRREVRSRMVKNKDGSAGQTGGRDDLNY